MFVAAHNSDSSRNYDGAVYVFLRTQNEWSRVKKIFPSETSADDFGFKFDVSDRILAVGDPGYFEGGVFIYDIEVVHE